MSVTIKKVAPFNYTVNGKAVVMTGTEWVEDSTLTNAERQAFGRYLNSLNPLDRVL